MVNRALLAVFVTITGISLAYPKTPVQTESRSVPAGVMLHCRTLQTLTTKLNSQGDAFSISVAQPVVVDGHVAIPAGSVVSGRITLMERPGRLKGVGELRLRVEQISFPDGRSFPLSANLLTVYGPEKVRVVGSEGVLKGPSSRMADFEEIGAGTAGGMLLGLLFAHPVIGATVGVTATAVDRMRRRGKDLTIPIGTELNYQLSHDLIVSGRAMGPSASILSGGTAQ